MVPKRREYTPLRRRVLTRKYLLLASLLNHAVEHCLAPNLLLVGRFLHAKVDTLPELNIET